MAHSSDNTQSTTSSSTLSDSCYPSSSNQSDYSAPIHAAMDDPTVIVGLACRVPGAQNPSQLWDHIIEQKDVQRKIPSDRFNVDAFYHPDGTNKGTTNSKYGYFLDQNLGDFDAGFFNISGKEAEAMDPQQRILLEVVYEALEDAGIPLQNINGSQTSVFCGCFTNDYNAMTTKDLSTYPKYTVTGTGNSILANRISYFYNLHGPSATVDTACSSSLVCFHMGNQSIRNQESDLSIVVGSALHFDPNIFITMTDLGMLSTDGRCRAFDASGRGYVRGEGVCAAILKRKGRAELDGDTIRAVVRGTAVNHDGRKQGITLPSSETQEDLIRRTYSLAKVNPADTQYFEAHGTGTAAGDPREARAIGAVFSGSRDQPLNVGSVKTNIGHLEGASGVAGIIKATLALEHKTIPPNMHFQSPNPEIDFESWKINVPTRPMQWHSSNGLRRASINSFGYGGTNAHVILERVDLAHQSECRVSELPERVADKVHGRPYLIPLSSHSEKAGKILAGCLSTFLERQPELAVQNFAYSLAVRRSMHRYRSFVVASNLSKSIDGLKNPPPASAWTLSKDTTPRLGFVMTGQGGQWFAMGRQLIEKSPLFKSTLGRCDDILQSLPDSPDWSVIEELLRPKETSRLAETRFSQPICTALQLAILDLLAQWGIKPSAVVGHSSGEMAAAYAVGILSFENTIVAAYYRGLYMSNSVEGVQSKPGAMLAVGMSEAEVLTELSSYRGRIALAAINSPSTMTLSGDEDAITELKGKLSERKIFARQLQVAQAFHSHHMDPLAPGYEKALSGHAAFKTKAAKLRMFSSVTARVVDPSLMGASYWATNMTDTVKFSDALTGIVLDDLDEQSVDILVEIGPHPALKGPSRQVLQSLKLDIPYLASLTRGVPDYEGLLTLAGQLYMLGYPVDLVGANSDHFMNQDDDDDVSSICSGHKLGNLPSYSWDHARYWAETRVIKNHRLRSDRHSLLGVPIPSSTASHPSWRNYLRLNELPWLADHVIEGKVIFPAAGYISMALEAIARRIGNSVNIKWFSLRDIAVKSALTLNDKDAGAEVILELRPASTSTKTTVEIWHEFTLFSFDDGGRSTEHCRGFISAEPGTPTAVERIQPYPLLQDLEQKSDRRIHLQNYYGHLNSLGLQYGEDFRLLCGDLESGPGFAMAPLTFRQYQISPELTDVCILHPALLDASLHVTFAAIESELGRPLNEAFVPTFLRSLKVSGTFTRAETASNECHFHVCSDTSLSSPRTAINDIRLLSQGSEELLVDIQGLQLTALGGDAGEIGPGRSLFFHTRWQPAFDFLSPSDCLSSISGIDQIMDIFAHQHPNAQILHIGPIVESSKLALSLLGGREERRRRFRSYTPFPASSDEFRKLEEEWNAGLITFEEPKAGYYDLVLVEADTGQNIVEFVKPGGIVMSNGPNISSDKLTPLFSNGDFYAWKTSQSEVNAADSLAIVLASAPSDRTKAIASSLAKFYSGDVSNVVFTHLSELEWSGMARNIVVLTSLDDDLFVGDSASESKNYDSVQSLLTRGKRNIVWLLQGATMDAQRPEHAIVSGLARSARSENDHLRLVTLDMAEESEPIHISQRILQVLDSRIEEDELTERNGTLYIPRIEADDMLNAKIHGGVNSGARFDKLGQEKPLALKIGKVGLLETLAFSEDETLMDSECGEDELEIEVKASAINFRDIAAAMGIIEDHKLGDECSGVVIRKGSKVNDADFEIGDRVVAWRPGQGAHCTVVRNPASLCYKLGDMPFEIAAAMPLILTTAHYALVDVARLQAGETVLVHSAAGGVGQMAVQIAHNIGARVIATVGSQAKRDLLKSNFGITDDQIFPSRDDSFVAGVMKFTDGKGVDVALNSLAGKLLHATWGCIAPFGRFVEIGKRDIHENSQIQMDPFRKNVTFASVDLITMFERNKPLGARVFQECCRLVHEGLIVPPETVTELPYSEAEKGFRLLQMGKHTGKVVLIPSPENRVPIVPAKYRNTRLFNPSKIYLLVGGLGGLGRTLAEWMVRKGARNLVFFSRSGAQKADAKATIDWLQKRNISVSVYQGDVTNYADVQACIEGCGQGLAGIFQAAMVLKDAPLDQMSFSQWDACMQPKVRGTFNLHSATLQVPLDFFVCFSSVSTIMGSKAQANYSAANAYIDALMLHRRQMGLQGTTMNCGMIVGVGAVAEDAALQQIMERIGYDAVNEQELLFQIEEAVSGDSSRERSVSGYDRHQIITGINLERQDFFWADKPLFRNLYLNHDFNGEVSQQSASKNVSVLLSTVTDVAERTTLLTASFVDKIAAVLGVSAESVQPQNPLSAYGLDSIVAVEFRKWFSKSVGVDLALFDILGSKSISALVSKVAGLIKVGPIESKPETDKKSESTKQIEKEGEDQSLNRAGANLGPIASIDNREEIPMSTFQRRLWFLHNINEDKTLLNFPVILRLKGQPNIDTLQRALLEVQKKNDSLRMSYFEGDTFAEQKPVDDVGIRLEYYDFSRTESPSSTLEGYASEYRRQELDIEDGQVFRAALTKLDETEYALLLVFHHIAIDRGSSKSFLSQLTLIYDAIEKGKNLSSISSPKVQYTDFSIWHNALLQSQGLDSDIEFWKEKFAGASGVSKLLPFAKRERPQQNDSRRSSHKATIDPRLLKRMKRVCSQMGTTPFQFLLTAFRSFLYRYTEEKDVTILMIDGNRPHPDLEDVLGFFVNMIPLRCVNDCQVSFDELLGDMKKVALEAIEHSQIPFDGIVNSVDVEQNPGHFPLGQVVLNYQMHGKMPIYSTQDFNIYDVASKDVPTACELQLEAMEDPENGLDLHIEYSTTLYDSDDMDRFLDNFLTFTTSVIKDHRQPIHEVPMCGPKEVQHLRDNYWNTSFKPNTWNGNSVMQKIFEVAKAQPRHVAIQTSDQESITYEKLVSRARRIAFSLRREGAVPGQRIGLFSRPGIDAVAGMLGILLVRCGYVPLDPDFAANRLAFMLADSECSFLLYGQGLGAAATDIALITQTSPQTMAIEEAASGNDKLGILKSASPDDPFYVIYTSGSTGKPKGVLLTQSNTQQMLSTLHHDYAFDSNDRFLHQSSISFDLSVVQIFSALTAGAVLCIGSTAVRKDPPLLADFMQRSAVTVTYFTPSQLALLLEYANESLRRCQHYRVAFSAGERLPVRVAKAFYDLETSATLFNTWSPSELVVQTTIHKTAYPEPATTNIPIGYPLANCCHYITDSRLNPLPSSLVGEICVGGAQVGAGYLNRPDANAKSFIDDPFYNDEDRRRGWTKLFRTGDRGRFLADGQLEFHGRIAGDKQIKLRGYRIDLAEVEQRIYVESSTDHGNAIVDVAVVARAIKPDEIDKSATLTDNRQIVAFIVPRDSFDKEQATAFVTLLHEKMGVHLNDYMLPNGYQILDSLPVTIGGKVDRQSLLGCNLELVLPLSGSTKSTSDQHTHQGSFDMTILHGIMDVFRTVLKLPSDFQIAATDNFFKLGGQSILLLRLQAKIKRALKTSLTLTDLLKAPTPAGVYAFVTAKSRPKDGVKQRNIAEIDWSAETTLPNDGRYKVASSSARNPSSVKVSEILLTGVDSFIGVHMLQTFLTSSTSTKVHVIGTLSKLDHSMLTDYLRKYKLLTKDLTEEIILYRVNYLPGALSKPHFGLDSHAFKHLGQSIQAIYHFGSQMSLVKTYTDLKPVNVSTALDIIELAACCSGKSPPATIHHLSTWSVPHLQTWSAAKRTNSTKIELSEQPATHFSPPPTDALGYFKSRWVAECLMAHAAQQRGFHVSIYRASAVTSSTVTGVPEPEDDFIRRMVMGMVEVGAVPRLGGGDGGEEEVPFAVDFVPVNHLVENLWRLSTYDQRDLPESGTPTMPLLPVRSSGGEEEEAQPKIYHLGNPKPLPLSKLPQLIGDIRGDGTVGRSLEVGEWFEKVLEKANDDGDEEARLRWNVLREYFQVGWRMFALDDMQTHEMIQRVGGEVRIPVVDGEYLRGMRMRGRNGGRGGGE